MTIHIGILTQKSHSYAETRLLEASKHSHHKISLIQLSTCYMPIRAKNPEVFTHDGRSLKDLDAVIPRFRAADTFYGSTVLRQFESMGIFTLNSSLAITWTRNKLRALQLLAKKNIPLPTTGVADSPTETEKLIHLVGGAPLIIKLIETVEGRGTIFAGTHQAAISVINAFKQINANIILQEYFKESEDTEIRCMVVGKEVVAAFQRTKTDNKSARIQFDPDVTLTTHEKRIATKATEALKLNFASVNIIRTHRGPLVSDVDCLPNIEMFETLTKVDIIMPLLAFIENRLKSDRSTSTTVGQ